MIELSPPIDHAQTSQSLSIQTDLPSNLTPFKSTLTPLTPMSPSPQSDPLSTSSVSPTIPVSPQPSPFSLPSVSPSPIPPSFPRKKQSSFVAPQPTKFQRASMLMFGLSSEKIEKMKNWRYDPLGKKLSFSKAIQSILRSQWVILPTSSFLSVWSFFIVLLLSYYLIDIPLRIGLELDECNDCVSTVLHLLADIFFLFDCLFIQIRTAIYLPNKLALELDPKKIAINYLTGWFFLDFVTSFPINHILASAYNINDPSNLSVRYVVQAFYLFRLAKIFRFNSLLRYYQSLEFRVGSIFSTALKVCKFVFGFFLVAHISACVWVYIALTERVVDSPYIDMADSVWTENTWLGYKGFAEPLNITATIQQYNNTYGGTVNILAQESLEYTISIAPILTTGLAYLMALYWSVCTVSQKNNNFPSYDKVKNFTTYFYKKNYSD
jgi:hypothetical protein